MAAEQQNSNAGIIKLLIADDDQMTRVVLKNIFKRLGWECDIVENGVQVLEKLKQTAYDLILMDVEMPQLDGYQTTARIRNELTPPQSEIPIIAITAHDSASALKKCLDVGMNDYLVKPLTAAELRAKIKRAVNKDIAAAGENSTEDAKPIIDLQALFTACGDVSTVKSLVGLFVSQTPTNIQQLKDFLTAKDWSSLGKLSHKMKASYALIGLPMIKDYLQEIEHDCERNTINLSKFESYLALVQETNAKAIDELESYLAGR